MIQEILQNTRSTMNSTKHLAIFMYHAVIRTPLQVYDSCFLQEDIFRKQLKFIDKHYEIVPLSQAVERLNERGKGRPMAVLTFDDGFQNNYDVVFPILQKAKIPASIFPVSRLVDTTDTVWFCRINRALTVTNKTVLKWDGCSWDLSNLVKRAKASLEIQERLKKYPHPQILSELRQIVLDLGDNPEDPIGVDSPYRMLSRGAIEEMAASGLVEFGGHTYSHAILSQLSSEDKKREIEQSIIAIRELSGSACVLFAYPNGCRQDYDEETIQILKACGIQTSVTTIWGANNEMTDAMELKRYGFDADLSMIAFKGALFHGLFSYKWFSFQN